MKISKDGILGQALTCDLVLVAAVEPLRVTGISVENLLGLLLRREV